MRQQKPGHTLQTTALIHETYLRLIKPKERNFQNRTHFFAAAAQAMRHILVDYARSRQSAKRGGGGYAETALGVINAIANNKDMWAVVNVPNKGAIPFLADDAVVETACIVNKSGIKPLTLDGIPSSVWGIVCAVKNYEQLAVEAAVEGNRDKALLALLAHPLIMDYDLACPLLDELLEANKRWLPQFYPS